MEVILLEDIQGLGYKDDIVKVKNGYGRNYLIPTRRAVIASESARKVLAEKLKQRAHKLEKIKQEAVALGEKLSKVPTLVIATKVSPTGVIYGSVNSLQISDKLKEAGFDIDRKRIDVKGVKEIGHYKAEVHLHKEVTVEVPFDVVDEDAKVTEESVKAAEKAAKAEEKAKEAATETEKAETTEEEKPAETEKADNTEAASDAEAPAEA